MSRYYSYFPHIIGYNLIGIAKNTRGLLTGFDLETIGANSIKIDWVANRPACWSSLDYYYNVYLDGEFINRERGQDSTIIAGLRPDTVYRVDIFPITRVEKEYINDCGLFYTKPRGNRIKLNWTAFDGSDTDFYSYLIYWDNSREDGNCDTLLDELMGINNTTYTTAVLDELTYSFKLAHKDLLGNISALGTVVAKTIDTYPMAVEDIAASYSQATRRVVLTWTIPAGQASDVVGYAVYSNYLIGQGLQAGLCAEKWNRISLLAVNVITYLTYVLFAGNWKFCVKAVDRSGAESDYTEVEVNLVMSGNDLIETDIKPDKPYYIDTEALSGGRITVTTKHNGTNCTHIKFYKDDVLVDTQAYVSGTITYTYTTGDLGNVEADFYTKAANNAVLSEASDTVTETSDNTAPTGTKTLTAEVVF